MTKIPETIRKAAEECAESELLKHRALSPVDRVRLRRCLEAAYLACYEKLMSGEPDGYIAHSQRHGYDKTSFRSKESLVVELMVKGFPPGDSPFDAGWSVVPVKILKMEE
jgi:hypothetical protein